MEWLQSQDRALLLLVNGWHSEPQDWVMTLVSDKLVWIPAYAALLLLLYKVLGWRKLLLMVVILAPVILVSDQVASGLLKPLVHRPRPCHQEDLDYLIHLGSGKCGGAYGFASSHAANFFALASYVGWFLRTRYRWLAIGLFVIATLVAYSRVYLGVHYPGDVLAGALVGVLAGWLGIILFKKIENRLHFPQSESK